METRKLNTVVASPLQIWVICVGYLKSKLSKLTCKTFGHTEPRISMWNVREDGELLCYCKRCGQPYKVWPNSK